MATLVVDIICDQLRPAPQRIGAHSLRHVYGEEDDESSGSDRISPGRLVSSFCLGAQLDVLSLAAARLGSAQVRRGLLIGRRTGARLPGRARATIWPQFGRPIGLKNEL